LARPRFDEEEYMPRPEKVQAVENIREQVDEARATFITEYRGLTVAEQQQLRRDIRQAQGEYRVLKMSLARRAVEDMEVEGLTELLAGPTALAFASNDPVPVAKALKEFASEHDSLIIKGGLLAGTLLPPEQISRLAEIESRDVLLGKIAGGFKSPMSKLAGMLGAKMRDAASMFSQLLEKKETEGPAPEAEAPAGEVTEEAPAAGAEEATDAESAAEPAAEAEDTPEAEAEEIPEAEAEEIPEAEAEEAPEAEAEEIPEAEAEETPEAEVDEPTEVDAEETRPDEPEETKAETEAKPKKKAAPKAEAEESAAPADANAAEEATSDADETAEEE
jgi:large subunit ribosomal protein L10